MKLLKTAVLVALLATSVLLGQGLTTEAKTIKTRQNIDYETNKKIGIIRIVRERKINNLMKNATIVPQSYPYIYYNPYIRSKRFKFFDYNQTSWNDDLYKLRLLTKRQVMKLISGQSSD